MIKVALSRLKLKPISRDIELQNIEDIEEIMSPAKEISFMAGGEEFKVSDKEFMSKLKTNIKKRKEELSEKGDGTYIIRELSNLAHIDGIPFLAGKDVFIELYADRVIIGDPGRGNTYKIKMENIVDIKVKTETEISEQERHVLARAVAGGLLFGGAGAIVGAVSGVPGKQIKTIHNFLIVDYLSKDGEQKSMMFLYKSANRKPLEGLIDAVFEIKGKKQPDGREVEL